MGRIVGWTFMIGICECLGTIVMQKQFNIPLWVYVCPIAFLGGAEIIAFISSWNNVNDEENNE